MKWSGIKKGQYRKRAHDDKNSRYEKFQLKLLSVTPFPLQIFVGRNFICRRQGRWKNVTQIHLQNRKECRDICSWRLRNGLRRSVFARYGQTDDVNIYYLDAINSLWQRPFELLFPASRFLGPFQTPCLSRAELNLLFRFDFGAAVARRLKPF